MGSQDQNATAHANWAAIAPLNEEPRGVSALSAVGFGKGLEAKHEPIHRMSNHLIRATFYQPRPLSHTNQTILVSERFDHAIHEKLDPDGKDITGTCGVLWYQLDIIAG